VEKGLGAVRGSREGVGDIAGVLHTTWRNSGAGVSGAAVDIGDPGSEGETVDAEKPE